VSATRRWHPGLPGPLARLASGVGAVSVKELRGRMRGRRAFFVLTAYLVVLAGVAWMIELFLERVMTSSFGSTTSASTEIGRGVFIGLMLFETLLVTLLAPAFTAGSISLEREKQTLDLLTATPISSLGIVIGKLLSALTYVFMLIAASIPLTAIVFMFGGVAPDDMLRGYVVLVVTALGFGTVGLFCSALLKRTQAATVVTYIVVLGLTIGTLALWGFWTAMLQQTTATVITRDVVVQAAPGGAVLPPGVVGTSDVFPPDQAMVRPPRAPAAVLWLDPFVAQIDVFCGTETSGWGTCSWIAEITGRSIDTGVQPVPLPAVGGAIDLPGKVGWQAAPIVAADADPLAAFRDTFWPVFAAAWLVVSLILVLLSVQLVAPTRRWRLRRRRPTRQGVA
jgi:ABC-type transport system involved in multi-copper enzyme maturation permease subunit